MIEFVLTLHEAGRWVVLAILVWGVLVETAARARGRGPGQPKWLGPVAAAVLDMQFLTGSILYLSARDRSLLGHAVVMAVAVFALHGIRVFMKKAPEAKRAPYALLSYAAPLAIILVGLLWLGSVVPSPGK